MKPAARVVAAIAAVFLLAATSSSQTTPTPWRLSRGDVRVLCPMTVGGSFEARTSALSGTLTVTAPKPVEFTGEVSVDLRTLDTGIGLRNEHLRDNYLEVSKVAGYESAVLTEVRLPEADAANVAGRTRFTGKLKLHGLTKPVEGVAEIKRTDGLVRVVARFTIHLPDFEIAKPRYLGVGVKDDVQLTVAFDAAEEGKTTR